MFYPARHQGTITKLGPALRSHPQPTKTALLNYIIYPRKTKDTASYWDTYSNPTVYSDKSQENWTEAAGSDLDGRLIGTRRATCLLRHFPLSPSTLSPPIPKRSILADAIFYDLSAIMSFPTGFQLKLGRFLDVLMKPNSGCLLRGDRCNYPVQSGAINCCLWLGGDAQSRVLVLCGAARCSVAMIIALLCIAVWLV